MLFPRKGEKYRKREALFQSPPPVAGGRDRELVQGDLTSPCAGRAQIHGCICWTVIHGCRLTWVREGASLSNSPSRFPSPRETTQCFFRAAAGCCPDRNYSVPPGAAR